MPSARLSRGRSLTRPRLLRSTGLNPVQVSVTALEIWKASRGQVQSLKQYDLGFARDQDEEWRKILGLLTRAAEG